MIKIKFDSVGVQAAIITIIGLIIITIINIANSRSALYNENTSLKQKVVRLEERIKSKDDRIASKNDLLDSYRERVYEIKARGSKYSGMALEDLKSEALKFSTNLRSFIKSNHKKMNSLIFSNEQDNSKINIKALNDFGIMLNSEYNIKYKVDAILLKDELFSRLPDKTQRGKEYLYDNPTNLIGMEIVATDIERLAKLLK